MSETSRPAVSLYQRYRPQRFADLVGQEIVAESLRRAVAEDRPSHAYLFEGAQGTGKTSTARILAKALNCMSPQEPGEPCNECDSCLDITEGVSMDYNELDMGSAGGVESIREVIQRSGLATPGKWRVVVFDEAHLMSPSAASALLKYLEESPQNVVTILCTTEPHKLLRTVLSRVQRRNFKRADYPVMRAHLDRIVQDLGASVVDADIDAAILEGAGSFRDTLSALESIIETGKAPESHAHKVVQALADADTKTVLAFVAEAIKDGEPPRALAEEVFALLRELFFIQVGAQEVLSTPDWGTRADTARALGPKRTVKAMELLGEAVVGMQMGGDGRVALEIALARFCALPRG